MGRPEKSDSERRNHICKIRLTETEWNTLACMAAAKEITVSEYVRRAVRLTEQLDDMERKVEEVLNRARHRFIGGDSMDLYRQLKEETENG